MRINILAQLKARIKQTFNVKSLFKLRDHISNS